MTFIIKTASKDIVSTLVDWAAQEGWNPGLCDAQVFYEIDPQGFFAGYLDGELIAGCSMMKYSDDFCFAGLYIVLPSCRGQGFGMQLTKHALAHAGDANIGADGVLEQVENYKKIGFNSSHKNSRYCYYAQGKKDRLPAVIKPISENLYPHVLDYDNAFFPAGRRHFMTRWLSMDNARGYVYIDPAVRGYGVIRQCIQGYKIGPLFADTPEIARQLFNALVNGVDVGESIYLDIPVNNQDAVKLVGALNMTAEFTTIRMYTKPAPDIALSRTFGITTFEVG